MQRDQSLRGQRRVPLDLQFDGHEEEDVTRWLPLLRRAPICTLRAAAGGEAVLRDAGVRARSAGSLVAAAAAVTCTDTLQWFPNLAWLELRVGAIDVLYPAVLDGVRAAHLGLVHYQRMALEELPPSLVATLRSVDVTPLPVARLSHFCLRLPPGIALRRLAVHGSFGAIASTKAAPRLNLDVASVCASCAHVLAEGRSLTFRLPRGAAAARRRSGAGGPGDWEVELAAALLEGWGATGWQRLELRLLCPFVFVWVELPLVGGHTGEASRVDLGPLATAVVNLSRGRVAALLSHERVSIFDVHCLVLERQGGEALVEQL
eukprot:scaffold1.g5448.t1